MSQLNKSNYSLNLIHRSSTFIILCLITQDCSNPEMMRMHILLPCSKIMLTRMIGCYPVVKKTSRTLKLYLQGKTYWVLGVLLHSKLALSQAGKRASVASLQAGASVQVCKQTTSTQATLLITSLHHLHHWDSFTGRRGV